jgi:hypothetical protein
MASARQSKNMCIAGETEPIANVSIQLALSLHTQRLTVGDEPKRVGPNSPQHLNTHVGQIETEEIVDLPAVLILEHSFDRRP